ncbi:hypothetical protein [Algoriphagus chordae]|uniref:Uncharacterized protein n=1 Tax=Algoriphagus chordae TaxID=237019 RepID=A0A2W7R6K4_9BACT|nr:hypothetical protein [Algoriphagus chordae]PZX55771.1 hypothetical protein LV85_00996 [Algoriphagus chordae]
MGHIKEPKGVDFLIKSPPLTDQERKEISEFIKERKSKNQAKNTPSKKEKV